ncbi:hypothetical protein KI387_004205, partial [Taxus chinensis]
MAMDDEIVPCSLSASEDNSVPIPGSEPCQVDLQQGNQRKRRRTPSSSDSLALVPIEPAHNAAPDSTAALKSLLDQHMGEFVAATNKRLSDFLTQVSSVQLAMDAKLNQLKLDNDTVAVKYIAKSEESIYKKFAALEARAQHKTAEAEVCAQEKIAQAVAQCSARCANHLADTENAFSDRLSSLEDLFKKSTCNNSLPDFNTFLSLFAQFRDETAARFLALDDRLANVAQPCAASHAVPLAAPDAAPTPCANPAHPPVFTPDRLDTNAPRMEPSRIPVVHVSAANAGTSGDGVNSKKFPDQILSLVTKAFGEFKRLSLIEERSSEFLSKLESFKTSGSLPRNLLVKPPKITINDAEGNSLLSSSLDSIQSENNRCFLDAYIAALSKASTNHKRAISQATELFFDSLKGTYIAIEQIHLFGSFSVPSGDWFQGALQEYNLLCNSFQIDHALKNAARAQTDFVRQQSCDEAMAEADHLPADPSISEIINT